MCKILHEVRRRCKRHVRAQRANWKWVGVSLADREWWMVVDNLLHVAEDYVPDRVLEFKNWRARSCTWATVQYEEPPIWYVNYPSE